MEKTKNSYKSIIYYWEGKEANRKAYISYSFTVRKQLEKKMMDLQCDSPSEVILFVNFIPLYCFSYTFVVENCSRQRE